MISAAEIKTQMMSALDAEGSDYYTNDQDYIPAINVAIDWLTGVINLALSENKISEEFFRNITHSSVFDCDKNGRISLKKFPREVWAILAVFPNPKTEKIPLSRPFKKPSNDDSYYRSDLFHVTAEKDCTRLTIEEWTKSKRNPFERGFVGTSLCGELIEYAYLNPINHLINNKDQYHSEEIEIRPIPNQATIVWVKRPEKIKTIDDSIEFPSSAKELLVNKALSFIAIKQGDDTTVYSISDIDITRFINAI